MRSIFVFLLSLGSVIAPTLVFGEGGSNTRVSVSSSNVAADAATSVAAISPDGKRVVFASAGTTLVSGDANGVSDIFVYDVSDAATTRVSVSSAEVEANGASTNPHFAGTDGRFVVFESEATNLIGSDSNAFRDCFLRDRELGTTERVNLDVTGGGANAVCSTPRVSADGRYVVFASGASDLVDGDTNGKIDVFLRDRTAGTTTRISLAADGTESDADATSPLISPDGAYVLFQSAATTLSALDENAAAQIYLYNVASGALSIVSLRNNQPTITGNGASAAASISDDGRYVVFESAATNLIATDTNGVVDCFLRDLTASTTERISVASDGTVANGRCANPMISGEGRYVAFASEASNLATGDTDTDGDIYVRDLNRETTAVVSDGVGDVAANGVSSTPTVEADGNRVVFLSAATNLIASDANGVVDAFLTENDVCPDDATKTNPGACGCGSLDTDGDGDSVADCLDECPANPLLVAAGRCGCENAVDTNANNTPYCLDPTASTVPGPATVVKAGRSRYRIILKSFVGYSYELRISSRLNSGGRTNRTIDVTNGNSRVVKLQPGRHRITYVVNISTGVTSQESLATNVRVR